MGRRLPGRWVGIGIAILVVGALALYAGGSGGSKPAAQNPTSSLFAPVDGQTRPEPVADTVPGMSAKDVVSLIVKLGVVAAILGGSLWLLRRYAGASNRAAGRTGAITVADTIVLAQGRALYLIDVGDRALVLGATPQQLSCLAELSDPDVLEKLRTVPERPAAPFAGLSERLAAAMAPRRAEAAAVAAHGARAQMAYDDADQPEMVRPARRRAGGATFAEALTAQSASAPQPMDDGDDPTYRPRLPARRALSARRAADTVTAPADAQRRAAMMARIKAMREPSTS